MPLFYKKHGVRNCFKFFVNADGKNQSIPRWWKIMNAKLEAKGKKGIKGIICLFNSIGSENFTFQISPTVSFISGRPFAATINNFI